jgi:hypothetical protein
MADLVLKGTLNLTGMLTLSGSSGGKVKVEVLEALVELIAPGDPPHSTSAPPVTMPPPPAGPIDTGPKVWIINSFNKMVKAGTKPIVTQGIMMQGNVPTWPGMVLPSQGNSTVTINHIPINVQNDQGVVFPSGGTATFTSSGQ